MDEGVVPQAVGLACGEFATVQIPDPLEPLCRSSFQGLAVESYGADLHLARVRLLRHIPHCFGAV